MRCLPPFRGEKLLCRGGCILFVVILDLDDVLYYVMLCCIMLCGVAGTFSGAPRQVLPLLVLLRRLRQRQPCLRLLVVAVPARGFRIL